MKQFHFLVKFSATIILLFLSSYIQAQATNSEQSPGNKRVTIIAKESPVQEIFRDITRQTSLRFSYNNKDVNQNEKISAPFVDVPVDKVLKHIFAGRAITWVYIDNIVRIGKGNKEQGPSAFLNNSPVIGNADTVPLINVTGQIVDSKGNPVAGAAVSLRGLNRGRSTDNGGNFSFSNIRPDATLLISSLGYESKQVKIAGQTTIRVSLDSLIRNIEAVEIVSTGYQSIPKERATGSFVRIDNKKYNEQVGTNFLSRLPVIASSVNVLPSNLGPEQVTIRGISTINGPKAPLIILDNFPYEGDLNNINPNDIESISILRDAAAASIWGARAGNGVIVVTTKAGRFNERLKVELNANLTIQGKPDLFYLKQMSASDYIDLEKFLFSKNFYNASLNSAPRNYQSQVVDILEMERKLQITPAEATERINKLKPLDMRNDYMNYVYQQEVNQQYSLNVRGGSNNVAWLLSGGVDRNVDDLAARFNRYNFRFDNIYRPAKNLQINAGVYYTYSQNLSGKTGYGGISSGKELAPYVRLADDYGVQTPFAINYRQSYIDTAGKGMLLDWKYYPLDDYLHSTSTVTRNNLIGRIGTKYSFLKGFTVDLKYQIEKQTTDTRALDDAESFYARNLINRFAQINYTTNVVTWQIPRGGILNVGSNDMVSHNARAQINYDKVIGKSAVTAIAGTEIRDVNTQSSRNTAYGYNVDLLTTIPVNYTTVYQMVHPQFGTSTVPGVNTFGATTSRFVSIFLNAAYTYNDKYTVSASGRRDASNIFGVEINDKWNPLWSTGLGWDISKEDFYKFSFLPRLKLRTSYGYSGNVSPSLASVPTIRYTTASIYTGGPTARVSNFRNPDLSWEKVRMFNAGVDFSSKKNIINGSVEFYLKRAEDLYGNAPIDRTLGLATNQVMKNYASLHGHGVDIILNSTNIKREIVWTSDLLFSSYSDKIVKFYFPSDRADNYVGGNATALGYPRYSLFTYRWAGLNGTTGSPQGYIGGKLSTNYDGLIGDSANLSDLKFNGSVTPKYFGSLGNTISWKGFSLTARISYQLGYYFLRPSNDYSYTFDGSLGHSDFAMRWQKPGDEKATNVPSLIYPLNSNREFFYANSEVLATKGDHIRLQYINVSYGVSENKCGKLPFSDLRAFVVVNNLGVIWKANPYGIDPDYNNTQSPPAKSFSIGINATL